MILKEKDRLLKENARKDTLINGLKGQNDLLKDQQIQLKGQNLKAEKEIKELKEKVSKLERENSELSQNLKGTSQKDLEEKVNFESEREKEIKDKYIAEINRLRNFVLRYKANLPDPCKGSALKKRKALTLLLNEILKDNPVVYSLEDAMALVDKLDNAVGGKVEGDQGAFNMDDVLTPGELDLESLCKELGVME